MHFNAAWFNQLRGVETMPVSRFDHFTIVSADPIATVDFYKTNLGLKVGPRPAIKIPGYWLYCNSTPVVHILENVDAPQGMSAVDHIAFWGTDLKGTMLDLKSRGVEYELNRLPDGGSMPPMWQLFFSDPNGVRVEIAFASDEDPGPNV